MNYPEKPRVLHIVPALFDRDDGIIGGGERYALELARHMAVETPTSLVTFGERERSITIGDLRVRVIGNPWRVRGQHNNPFSLALLGEVRNAEVIHCHQQHVFSSTAAALVSRLTGRRVFVTDLGGGGWDISAYVSTDRLYDAHLHLSEYSRMIFGHRGKTFARVIYGGVDSVRFSPARKPFPGEHVLFVGRILPHKGVNYLIEAMPQDAPLVIAGPAPDARYLAALRRIASGKRVTFIHDCSDDALIELYRRALCVVLPSVYRTMYGNETRVPELLGQTLLEGMACGAPVICTNVASMPEIVEHGLNGFIVPPNDAVALGEKIRWLIANPERAPEMGSAGRRRVLEKFTWPQVVERCLEAYLARRRITASSQQGPGHEHAMAYPDR